MNASQRPHRRALLWAGAGVLVLLGGIVAIVVGIAPTPPPAPNPSGAPLPSGSPAPPSETSPGPDLRVVDPSAPNRGWVAEPITPDPDSYARAALTAAATFDTTLANRDDWLSYLDTWFTPDTRYPVEDRERRMDAARLELRQGVVFPEELWDSLAQQDGRVTGEVTSDPRFLPVPDDASGEMQIATGDVIMTFTQTDGAGAESSYTETARVSVQILCGPGSVPVPDSPQQAGDCKVVRFFTEPVEE